MRGSQVAIEQILIAIRNLLFVDRSFTLKKLKHDASARMLCKTVEICNSDNVFQGNATTLSQLNDSINSIYQFYVLFGERSRE